MIKKKTNINLQIHLDEKNIPEKIFWHSQDGNISNAECKAFILSIWNNNKEETSTLELWIKNMPIQDMNKFFYHTFLAIGNAYQRATSNQIISQEIKNFGYEFLKKVHISK